jgi:hypothetical protein
MVLNTNLEETLLGDDNEQEDNNNIDEIILNDEENYKSNIFDLSLELDLRLNIITKYYQKFPDEFLEIISRLSGMYSFSGTKTLEKFLFSISTKTEISSFLKIEAVKSLLSFSELEEEIFEKDDEDFKEIKRESNEAIISRNNSRSLSSYSALNLVCKTLDDELSTPCKVETIFLLMKNQNYKNEALEYFIKIINNQVLDCDYRYKTILSIEKRGIELHKFFTLGLCLEFIKQSFNYTMYKILASQNILQNCEPDLETSLMVENALLSFANDETLDYNLRADAADTLLTLGSDSMKIKGREIIYALGRFFGEGKTIFENAQNVHTSKIEESVMKTLESLSSFPTLKNNNENINYDYVFSKIIKKLKKNQSCDCDYETTAFGKEERDEFCSIKCKDEYESQNKIKISLNRIFMDKTYYFNNTLSTIIVKLWSYIKNNENKKEMKKRLLEELEDMSGTCSSGFLSRLINVLSGFGEFDIYISWDDQIISNFAGRLNSYARKITDNDSPFYNKQFDSVLELYLNKNKLYTDKIFKDRKELFLSLAENREEAISNCVENFSEDVLNEMMIKSSNFAKRQNFLLFFRTFMPSIYEEMFNEFKNIITDSEFELAFRKAISCYEGENEK